MRTAVMALAALLLGAGSAAGAMFFVNADGTGDYATIQAAIDAVAANSVIELADGVYAGAGNRDLDFHGKALTLRSASGHPAACVIDCQGAGRGFTFHTGETGTSAVKGITIRNGYAADYGGGVSCVGASPALLNCVITACEAELRGGGIYGSNSEPVVNSCVIAGNTAQYGGGIAWWSLGGDLWNDLVTGNSADYGDAIYTYTADVALNGCTFDTNYGRGYDSALYGANGGGFTITSCIVWNNDGSPMIRNAIVNYSCILGDGFTGTGNIAVDPQFVTGPAGGWYLATTSPCANAGGPYLATTFTTSDGLATRAGLTTRADEANDTGAVDMGYHHAHVNALAVPGRYATIQAALDAAWSGERIDVASGTYHERLTLRGRAVVLNGYGALSTVVDGDGAGCVLTINAGEGRGAVVQNLTLRHGLSGNGGGALVDGSSPTIAHCSIESNQATANGGGVAVYFGRPLLHDDSVQDNDASGAGGGVYCAGAGTRPVFEGGVLRNNAAVGDGGGLYAIWTIVTASDLLVHGNSAARGGGAALYGSTLDGTRLTIAHNSGATAAGGILCDDMGHAVLANTIIALSGAGAAVACLGTGNATLACCDVAGNAGGDWTGCLAGQLGVNGNISADPLFCDAAGGLYGLHSNSPCAAANSPGCGQIGAEGTACGLYVITVSPGGTGDYPTIQAAIDAASEGVVVQLAPGTYTGAGNWDLDYRGKAITVESAGGDPAGTIINCLDALSGPHRGFYFHSGEDSTSVLRAVTIQGGRTSSSGVGGAVLCSGGSAPKLIGCVIQQSSAYDGGGIYCSASSPIVEDCTFVNNTASDAGGALGVHTAAPEIRRCTFYTNWANWGGGAVSDYRASTRLWGCQFRSNSSNHWGGAVLTSESVSRTDIRGSTFQNNGADEGGALYGRNGSLTAIANCTFHDNTAGLKGGTLRLYNAGAATVTRTILWAESYWTTPLVSLQTSAVASFACSDLRDGQAGVDRDGTSTLTWGANNLSADPQFCGPPQWYLALKSTSPCTAENNPACGLIGAWDEVCSATGVDEPPPSAPPAVATLHPPVPNPFNPRTTIRFELPGAVRIKLAVYDLNGRLVARLAGGELPAGAHEVVWDGRDGDGRPAASGIYLCRLDAGGVVRGQRLALIR